MKGDGVTKHMRTTGQLRARGQLQNVQPCEKEAKKVVNKYVWGGSMSGYFMIKSKNLDETINFYSTFSYTLQIVNTWSEDTPRTKI